MAAQVSTPEVVLILTEVTWNSSVSILTSSLCEIPVLMITAHPPLSQLLGCMVWYTSYPRSLRYDSYVKCVSEVRQASIF
jgi:hypothetical protein